MGGSWASSPKKTKTGSPPHDLFLFTPFSNPCQHINSIHPEVVAPILDLSSTKSTSKSSQFSFNCWPTVPF